MDVKVLCFIQRLLSNLFSTLLAVQVSRLEIMLKQYCRSERVINHQADKSSGHCGHVMSVTFNKFGLLLVSWIISPLTMGQKIFCLLSSAVIMGDFFAERGLKDFIFTVWLLHSLMYVRTGF